MKKRNNSSDFALTAFSGVVGVLLLIFVGAGVFDTNAAYKVVMLLLGLAACVVAITSFVYVAAKRIQSWLGV